MRLKTLAVATALALAVVSEAAFAQSQSIGALDVRSRLGERFFGAVPVRTPDGILDPRCIRVAANPNAPAGAEALQGARVRVGSADTVIIETAGTVMSPVVGLRLEVGCDNPVSRDFVVMDQSASVPGLAAPATESAPAVQAPPSAVAATPAARPEASQRRAPRAATRTQSPRTPEPAADVRAAPAPRAAAAAAAVPPAATRAPAPAPTASAAETAPSASAAPDPTRRVADLRARADDHAAALLALDDRLALLQKQAELLKAQLEQALAVAPSAGPAASATAPSPAPSASSVAVAVAPAPAPATTPAASAPAATTTAAPQAAAAPAASPATASPVTPAPAARGQSVLDLLTDWKVAGGIAALLLGALAFKMRRRPTFKPEPSAAPASAAAWPPAALDTTPLHQRTQEVPVLAQAAKAVDTSEWQTTTRPLMVDQTAEWVPPPTTDSLPVPAASTQPATLPGAAMTREFHITQQFQPVAERVVALSTPEEIVQQARTHYMEDNDVFKAIDLLEMAVSARKDSPRPWQALFAIYRRENMPERFQRLVLAYRGVFGQDESWPAIRALGQQMDPTNPLYGEGTAAEPIPEDLVERWLGVPLDFTAHLLANEMHDQLMDTYSGRKRRKRRASE